MDDYLSPVPAGGRMAPSGRPYVLRVKLPGVAKENIMVAFRDGCVEIRGLARSQWEERANGIHYFESEETAAYHRVPLPTDADAGRARVMLSDGEAAIEIPRNPRA